MKEFKNLLFENQDGLGILTMNRPAALNALNKETMDELCELLTEIKNDPSIKVVILTGAEKSFVAGADIKEMLPMTAAEGQAWARLGQTALPNLQMGGDVQLLQQVSTEHLAIGSEPAGSLHHRHGGGIVAARHAQAYALHWGTRPLARACS